jgi:hypothetical protein
MTKKFNESWEGLSKSLGNNDKLTDNEETPVKISYTALVLDDESHQKLINAVPIPDGWEVFAHHMTINMGEAKDKNMVGETAVAVVKTLAMDEELGVVAVGVESEVPSKNKIKHVTMAVNRAAGAKPFHSNKLKNWEEAPEGLKDMRLVGVVTEVPFKN